MPATVSEKRVQNILRPQDLKACSYEGCGKSTAGEGVRREGLSPSGESSRDQDVTLMPLTSSILGRERMRASRAGDQSAWCAESCLAALHDRAREIPGQLRRGTLVVKTEESWVQWKLSKKRSTGRGFLKQRSQRHKRRRNEGRKFGVSQDTHRYTSCYDTPLHRWVRFCKGRPACSIR